MTASLSRVLFMEYRTTIQAIGKVEAMVVATILEIRSSPAWEYITVFGTLSSSFGFLLPCQLFWNDAVMW
jgi:hypothetical protein